MDAAKLAQIQKLLTGTTIDPVTLLSTDYFNTFNEVIMFLGMLPDMPDMMADIEAWQFKTYVEHFKESTLEFAPLAIEVYAVVEEGRRKRLEAVALAMKQLVETARYMLQDALVAGETDKFSDIARKYSMLLQSLVDYGASVVHGGGATSTQGAVDALF
jgi:hypothetical protein